MTDSEPPSSQDTLDVRQLGNAVRSVAFAFVIGLSYFNMTIVRAIANFDRIFRDMLGGKPLPFLTQIIIEQRVILLAIAVLIPSVALAALLTRRIVIGLYVLAAAGLIALLESGLVYHSMFAPFFMIIEQMSGAASSGI